MLIPDIIEQCSKELLKHGTPMTNIIKKMPEERALFTVTSNYILSVEYDGKNVSTTLVPLQAKWCADQASNFVEYIKNIKKYFIIEE